MGAALDFLLEDDEEEKQTALQFLLGDEQESISRPITTEEAQRRTAEELSGPEALLAGAGAEIAKIPSRVGRLFGAEGAQERLEEIEGSQEQLGIGSPVSAFGPAMIQAPAATLGLGLGLIPGGIARGAAAMGLGAAEATAFAPSDVNPQLAAGLGAGFGLGGEMIPAGLGLLRNRALRKGVGATEQVELAGARIPTEGEKVTGIELLGPQRTGDIAELQTMSFVQQLPEGSKMAAERLGRQNKEALDSVTSIIDDISPARATSTAATRIRSASQAAVATKEAIRSETASPIFKQANRRQRQGKTPLIDTDDVVFKNEEIIKQFDPKGEFVKVMQSAVNKIDNAGGDLAKLHSAKIEIDDILEARGDSAVGRTARRFLTRLQKDLISDMESQSPSYRAARDEFRRLSPLVDELREGVVGRVANLSDTQLKSAARTLLDPTEGVTNPESLKAARKAIEGVEGGEDAWKAIVRTEIENRLGSMRQEANELLAQGGVPNLPAMMRAKLFGNAKTKAILLESVDGETRRNLNWLDKQLSKASTGRALGSPTAVREEIARQTRPLSRIGKVLRSFSKPEELIDDLFQSGSIAGLARSIFEDRTTKELVTALRKAEGKEKAFSKAAQNLAKHIQTISPISRGLAAEEAQQ